MEERLGRRGGEVGGGREDGEERGEFGTHDKPEHFLLPGVSLSALSSVSSCPEHVVAMLLACQLLSQLSKVHNQHTHTPSQPPTHTYTITTPPTHTYTITTHPTHTRVSDKEQEVF